VGFYGYNILLGVAAKAAGLSAISRRGEDDGAIPNAFPQPMGAPTAC